MAIKFSVAIKNARSAAIEATIGQSAVLKVRSGAAPAAITDADSGTVLASMQLPTDWLASAINGVADKAGVWQDLEADANGTAGHYRIYAADGTTQHIQGTVTATGGGGDMTMGSTTVQIGQRLDVTQFRLTEGN